MSCSASAWLAARVTRVADWPDDDELGDSAEEDAGSASLASSPVRRAAWAVGPDGIVLCATRALTAFPPAMARALAFLTDETTPPVPTAARISASTMISSRRFMLPLYGRCQP